MDNETKISLQFNNGVNGQKKLEEYTKQLEKIYTLTSALNSDKASKTLGEINSTIKVTEQNTKDLKTKSKDLSKVFATAFSIGKVVAFGRAVQKVSQTLTKFVQASSSYIENVNLLEVAYKNANETIEQSSQRIETFIDKMADLYGLDESNLTRQFGVFKQMANAMQLPAETAEHLSEIMVKMTNDVASLYNLDLNRASNALQSALAGQVRPIRSATGADITEKTLQNTVDALELDRSISQLSYVEKRLVMVISLTNQLKQSQGDYARTIESTANQFRILGEQWSRLTRSVGNVFYNLLGSILPYLNGILMALTEIFNLIASLLGFEMPEFDYSNLSGVSDAALDIEDALDGAGASADSLKQKLSGLRGFDKLNVINTPKSSGGSASGGGVGGTIDPKILNAFTDAFGEYDDLMGKVRMKALDIRDAIMEWLGFTKDINPITGEVSWKYQGIQKTFDNLFKSLKDWFTNLNPLAQSFVEILGVLAGVKIVKGISNMVTELGKMPGQLGKITGVMYGATGIIMGLGLIKDGIEKIGTDADSTIGKLETLGGTYSSIIGGGVAGAIIGSAAGPTGTMVGAALGGLTGFFAGWIELLGDTDEAWGTTWDNMMKKSAEVTRGLIANLDEIKKHNKELADQLINVDIYSNKYKSLADQLTSLVDGNGKVKEGYETNVKYITGELAKAYGIEIKITDGVIENYDEIIKKIYATIEAKRLEKKQQLFDEIYNQTLADRNTLLQNQEDATIRVLGANIDLENSIYKLSEGNKDLQQNMFDYAEALKKGLNPKREDYGLSKKQAEKIQKLSGEVKLAEETLKDYDDQLDASAKIMYYHSQAENAMMSGDYETAQKYYALLELENIKYTNSEQTEFNKRIYASSKTWKAIEDEAKRENKNLYEINEKGQKRITNEFKTEFNEQFATIKAVLTDEARYINGVTPKMVGYWQTLAYSSSDAFNEIMYEMPDELREKVLQAMINEKKKITPEMVEQFKDLATNDSNGFLEVMKNIPDDLRETLIGKMEKAGYKISEDLQKGLKSITPTMKIDVDKSSADTKMDEFEGRINQTKWGLSGFFSGFNQQIDELKRNLSGVSSNHYNTGFNANGGIFYNGGWHDIAKYADGGLPPVGQMFVARENGAELVGTINNHTAVMNNDQIVDSVADGVYRAVVNANATTQQSKTSVMIPIQIGTKEIGRVVINDLQKMAKTNGKPIVIGG